MRALPCLDAGLRMVFVAIALGGIAVACGSISVIEPDGGDVRSGDGGASGGGQGGKADAGAGHDGGAIGGRTGGGLGGANGSLGGVSGGLGGVSGGLGGKMSGQGGATGGGGTMGGAGGGGSMVSCQQLQRDFAVAFADAKGCTMGAAGQCTRQTTDRLDCGCPTYVTSTAKMDLVRQAWSQNGCSSGICPAVLCAVTSGALCTLSAQSTASACVDQSGPTPLP